MKYKVLFYLSIISILGVTCNNKNMKPKSYTYLALGDSYTIGTSCLIHERYPHQLTDSLKQTGINIAEPKIIAKNGWTTDELSEGIDTAKVLEQYDLVTLLIGVNNQYQGRDIGNYKKEFNQLLNRAIKFAGDNRNKVLVISIPDWSVTPFAKDKDNKSIANEIDAYNAINFEACKYARVQYINVTEISRKAKTDSTLIAHDGLHPSGKMYTLWVKEIFPKALSALTNKY